LMKKDEARTKRDEDHLIWHLIRARFLKAAGKWGVLTQFVTVTLIIFCYLMSLVEWRPVVFVGILSLRLFEIQQKAFEPCFTGLDVVGRAKPLGAWIERVQCVGLKVSNTCWCIHSRNGTPPQFKNLVPSPPLTMTQRLPIVKWRAGLKGHQLTYDMHMVEKAIMNVHFWCGNSTPPSFEIMCMHVWPEGVSHRPPCLAPHLAHAASTPLALQGLILRLHHLVGAGQDGRMVS
jgi:hypothetical protein